MIPSKSFNIIVAGVGGQGVLTLTQIIKDLCEKNNITMQGSIHKGGAQQLGSIHSVLRLFFDNQHDARNYSTQLLPGDLDLMLGLEPWETLRYSHFFSRTTKVISNSQMIPIETGRYQEKKFKDPREQLKSKGLYLVLEDFSTEALRRFGTKKMLNFLIAEKAILGKLIPFSYEEMVQAFRNNGVRVDEINVKNSKEQ